MCLIYYPKLSTQLQITLYMYFQRIETLRKTQIVHCLVSFFNIWPFPQKILTFYATEKEILKKNKGKGENAGY